MPARSLVPKRRSTASRTIGSSRRSLWLLDGGLQLGLRLSRLLLELGGRRLGEDLLREVELRDALGRRGGLLAVLDPLQRERKAAPLGVDLDDLHGDDVALRDDLARVLDMVRGELRDVHEALDAREDL